MALDFRSGTHLFVKVSWTRDSEWTFSSSVI